MRDFWIITMTALLVPAGLLNGQTLGHAKDGSGVRGYSDPCGEAYFQLLPASVYGKTATVLARTYDVLGNMTETTGTLEVPAQ